MMFPVCERVERAWRDGAEGEGAGLPAPIFLSLRLHQINAFGYRDPWAEELLRHVRFNPQNLPFFPVSPATPEAHRHKFLCALALSPGSPGSWQWQGRRFKAADFVAPILAGPVSDWADQSAAPDPSWTLQYLSAHLDPDGRWQGSETPLGPTAAKYWAVYLQDFKSGGLWDPGKTPFTESGLHFLEALNQLSLRQETLGIGPFFDFKAHLLARLSRSVEEVKVLLENPGWPRYESRGQVLEFAISQLLVLGHLLEVCFHPRGALRLTWTQEERAFLDTALSGLASLLGFFLDPEVLALMNPEQRRAYPFPLMHAYSALKKSQKE